MLEGSGSGSIPLTNSSGSRRPENIQIRIRNTALNHGKSSAIFGDPAESFMIFSDVYTTHRQRGCREPTQCCEASAAGQAI
jgi:hypothetical protein